MIAVNTQMNEHQNSLEMSFNRHDNKINSNNYRSLHFYSLNMGAEMCVRYLSIVSTGVAVVALLSFVFKTFYE